MADGNSFCTKCGEPIYEFETPDNTPDAYTPAAGEAPFEPSYAQTPPFAPPTTVPPTAAPVLTTSSSGMSSQTLTTVILVVVLLAGIILFLVFGNKDGGSVYWNDGYYYTAGSIFSPDEWETQSWNYTSASAADDKALNDRLRGMRFQNLPGVIIGGVMAAGGGIGLWYRSRNKQTL